MSAGIKANVDGSAAIQVGGTDVITLTSGGAATFVTSPTTVQAGTAAAPSITFSGDTNTGIYSPGADQVAISTGGSKRFEINAVGNAGLGVAPNAWQSGTNAFEMNAAAIWARGASVGTEFVTNGYYNGAAYLYTNNGAAARYLQSGTTHTWYGAPSGTAGNAITFTPVMTVGTGVSLALENASSQAGTGITFPATQSASSNANTLDDYEEGLWTPTITAASGTYTAVTATGSYIKIGTSVTVRIRVDIGNNGTAATRMNIGGFPFAAMDTASMAGATRESQVTGNGFVASSIGTTSITVNRYDAVYGLGTGYGFTLCITYVTT